MATYTNCLMCDAFFPGRGCIQNGGCDKKRRSHRSGYNLEADVKAAKEQTLQWQLSAMRSQLPNRLLGVRITEGGDAV